MSEHNKLDEIKIYLVGNKVWQTYFCIFSLKVKRQPLVVDL